MKKKKKTNREKDFKVAKVYFTFFQFFGCIVAAYLVFKSIMEVIDSYANNQTGWAVMFLIAAMVFLYLVIHTARKGIQAIKAKKFSELP